MQKLLSYFMVSTLFLASSVQAVTAQYRVYCNSDYGRAAVSQRNELIDRMPGIFSRYASDVEWKIIKKAGSYFDVNLTATSKNRIDVWVGTLQTEGQDIVGGINELKNGKVPQSASGKKVVLRIYAASDYGRSAESQRPELEGRIAGIRTSEVKSNILKRGKDYVDVELQGSESAIHRWKLDLQVSAQDVLGGMEPVKVRPKKSVCEKNVSKKKRKSA
jgi:hypothetical protein